MVVDLLAKKVPRSSRPSSAPLGSRRAASAAQLGSELPGAWAASLRPSARRRPQSAGSCRRGPVPLGAPPRPAARPHGQRTEASPPAEESRVRCRLRGSLLLPASAGDRWQAEFSAALQDLMARTTGLGASSVQAVVAVPGGQRAARVDAAGRPSLVRRDLSCYFSLVGSSATEDAVRISGALAQGGEPLLRLAAAASRRDARFLLQFLRGEVLFEAYAVAARAEWCVRGFGEMPSCVTFESAPFGLAGAAGLSLYMLCGPRAAVPAGHRRTREPLDSASLLLVAPGVAKVPFPFLLSLAGSPQWFGPLGRTEERFVPGGATYRLKELWQAYFDFGSLTFVVEVVEKIGAAHAHALTQGPTPRQGRAARRPSARWPPDQAEETDAMGTPSVDAALREIEASLADIQWSLEQGPTGRALRRKVVKTQSSSPPAVTVGMASEGARGPPVGATQGAPARQTLRAAAALRAALEGGEAAHAEGAAGGEAAPAPPRAAVEDSAQAAAAPPTGAARAPAPEPPPPGAAAAGAPAPKGPRANAALRAAPASGEAVAAPPASAAAAGGGAPAAAPEASSAGAAAAAAEAQRRSADLRPRLRLLLRRSLRTSALRAALAGQQARRRATVLAGLEDAVGTSTAAAVLAAIDGAKVVTPPHAVAAAATAPDKVRSPSLQP